MMHKVCATMMSVILAFFATGCAVTAPGQSAHPPRPNLIFIMADDMGYGDLSCYGQDKLSTPNIDRMASEGIRFTNGYSGATICGPARSVLMTGLNTGHTRVRGNMADEGGVLGEKNGRPVRRMNLLPEDRTIANVLGEAGYVTANVGKWHLDGFDRTAGPLDRGFDEFYGWLVSEPLTYDSTYFPSHRYRNRELVAIPGNQNGGQGSYHPDMCIADASAFMEAHREGPFFLYLALNLPHSPYEAPELGPFADKDWPEMAKHYAYMVTYADKVVGEILAKVKALGIDDNTLIIFTSDNGPRSEPNPSQTEAIEFLGSRGGLRGYKRDLYEGGIREPMIARWPGHVPAGVTSDTPWYFPDVTPTFAELAGANDSDHGDGMSVVPTLMGKPQPELADRFMYWEDLEGPFEQAVRWHNWKGFRQGLEGKLELYDLDTDQAEQHDVADQHPSVVARIEDFLATARTDSPEFHIH